MPRTLLNFHKSYKATALRPEDADIKSAAPVSAADQVSPAMQTLVEVAEPAVEVPSASISSQKSAMTKKKSKEGLLSKKKTSAKNLPTKLKLRSLRHSASKAARKTPQASPSVSQASADIHDNSTLSSPTSSTHPQELVDGVKIRIRQPRRAATKKVASQIIAQNTAELASRPGVKAPAPLSKKKLSKTSKVKSPKVKTKKQPKSPKLTAQTSLTNTDTISSASIAKPRKFFRRQKTYRPTRADLINAESRLGSTIFGPIPDGHRREFFHDQQNVWIWHEGWVDANQHVRQMTVRYEVRPSGVYKKLSAGKYVKLEGSELENFRQATHVYLHMIKQKLYRRAS